MRVRIATLLWITTVLAAPSVQSQSLADDPRVREAIQLLDVWIDAQREYVPFPGMSAAIVHDQEIVWSAGFGYADREARTPATSETIYSICSISKLFTSIAMMQLRDAGRLRLDDPVHALLPWFRTPDGVPPADDLTVESLLTHSSGLPSGTGHSEAPGSYATSEQIRARVPYLEPLYPARRDELYSNLGMVLAGEIVAELSGEPYETYVTERILRPLGMSSTVPEIGDTWGADRMAAGYSAPRRGGERRRVDRFVARGMVPALGFASTVEDLTRFAMWQFRLLDDADDAVLAARTLREMYRVHHLDADWQEPMGLGFAIIKDGGRTFVGHAGFCPGFQSNFALQPDDRIATIAIANTMLPIWNYTSVAYALVAPAIRAARGDPGGGEGPLQPDLEKFVGAYDLYPWNGEYQVAAWQGGLVALRMPTDNPRAGLRELVRSDDNTFHVLDEAGWPLSDWVFEVGPDGDVLGVTVEGTRLPRLR